MQPQLPIPNPQFGLSRQRLAIPEGYAGPQDRADLVVQTNILNEIRFNELTHKQRFFLDSYICSGMDPLKAARDARLVPDEESDKQAIQAANRLIKKPYMQKAIEAALKWSALKAQIHAPDLINELLPLAMSNMADYLCPKTGEVVLPYEDRAKMAAIKEVKVDNVKVGRGEDAYYVEKTTIKLYDKVDAVMKLLKILGHDGAQDAPATQVNVQQNNTNTVAVSFNIVQVPSGQFLPPPEKPVEAQIERQPILGLLGS